MESEKWEICSSDGDLCTEDLKDEEDAFYPLSGSISKLQFRKASSRACWNSEVGMAEVVERKGQIWTTTGVLRGGKLYCSIEETLFLAEIGALVLVDENGTGLSLEGIYGKLAEEKNGCCWEHYEVYKHLKSLGYIVGRRGVPWTLKSVGTDALTEDRFITDRLGKLDLNGLEPAFDVYLPNGKFKKSSPGDPSYVLCLTRESPPSRKDVEVLERQSGHIPVKFCHVENGRVSFFSFSKVDLPVLP
ncbi:hypothetical protein SAY86_005440 [Trapa natans]|uniref:tRNA-splicing endonuclease subunit Sen54 N-terminal domain-containing protein n=1 Tax=Trapa natans TaxID=22666 RepID=A0AAN7L973_TRANT|nr:hypothetical protein SAY86_005440 [Trapa natans]